MSVLLPLLAALTIAAPAPYLVRDLNTAPTAGGRTASGLRDRSASSTLEWDPWLAALPGRVFFEATGSDGATQVWSSDGTAAGTTALVAADAYDPLAAGDQLFFLVRPDGRVNDLWRSDGTPGGTGPVPVPIVPDTTPEPLGVLGDRLLMGNSYGGGFRDLWITDGTDVGTIRLSDRSPDAGSSPEDVVALGARAVFTASSPIGRELWATDGTVMGTAPVADITAGGSTFVIGGAQLMRLGDAVLFPAAGTLWRSDGTAAGTEALAEIGASRFAAAFVAADHLFFVTDATPPALWASAGTAASTVPLADGLRAPRAIGAVNAVALFIATDDHGEALWASDGTASGTRRLRALAADRTREFTAACSSAACVFAADDGVHGSEPWRSDGTETGTALLADLQPGADASHPYGFTAAGARLVFLADDGMHGIEPWRTTGAAGNAHLIADIAAGAASSGLGQRDEAQPLLVAAGSVFLGADDGVHGRELWAIPLAALAPAGDCDDDGAVTVAELVRAVGIALGSAPFNACPAADANADGAVAIDDLIAAVTAAL